MSRFDERAKDWDKKQTSLDKSEACLKHLKDTIDFSKIKNILDYGCGTGLIAFDLVNSSNEVLGLDSSTGMLEEFNKKAKDKNLSNIRAQKHDILNDDLEENSFDLIVISMSLHHIENIEIFFEKSFKALKNGGYLCINDLEKEDGTFHKKHNNDGVYHFGFKQEELEQISLKVGFTKSLYERVFIYKRDYGDFPIFNFYVKKGSL
ncbi:class I SAM-dependent methyltransferase [Arcobacter lanthieri]|uniref:class I SAM-dependent methyltransferase n=1 Tax=Aliarcobacter lanthieri TaxID=1355374 RepID=UPI00192176F4|nr:class I SAM-dependent methyltransferase [Aliarcobacter lanthieri]MBL3519984.1 class I SAM-dependent methyltransferase [Aliarcobacter lanthieri]